MSEARNTANLLARECIVTALLQLLKEKPLTKNSRFVEMSVSHTGLQISRS